jgi:hypothetical protein
VFGGAIDDAAMGHGPAPAGVALRRDVDEAFTAQAVRVRLHDGKTVVAMAREGNGSMRPDSRSKCSHTIALRREMDRAATRRAVGWSRPREAAPSPRRPRERSITPLLSPLS